jgi:hypothetical protein
MKSFVLVLMLWLTTDVTAAQDAQVRRSAQTPGNTGLACTGNVDEGYRLEGLQDRKGPAED